MMTLPKPTTALSVPVEYVSPGITSRGRRFQILGVTSLVVGILSLFVSGSMIKGALVWRAFGRVGMTQGKQGLYWQEYLNTYEWGNQELIAAEILIGASCLLIIASILLIRSNTYGVPLHYIYAVVQILASVALARACMSHIANSPGGPVSYLGAIPGLIGCIYPFIIFVALPWLRG
jgi:hypothetical protein